MPVKSLHVRLNGFSAAVEEYNHHDMADRSLATGSSPSLLSEGLEAMNRLTNILELAVQNSCLTEEIKKTIGGK